MRTVCIRVPGIAFRFVPRSNPISDPQLRPARRVTLGVVLWAFGFATSLLLIGMWGRSVSVDNETVAESAGMVIDADLASERVYDWLADGLEVAASTDSATAQDVASAVSERPEFEAAVDTIVEDFVGALFADPGREPVVRVQGALSPLVPVVVAEFEARQVPVESAEIEQALDVAGVIELDTGEAASVAGVVREARTVLTVVVVVSALALVVLGVLAIALSDRRFAMIRTLSLRILISALTYALLFRAAAWALDPDRGRSPVLGGGSVVLGSNSHVFFIAAGLAAVGALLGGWVAWRRTSARRTPTPTIDDTEIDDDTRELLPV